MEDLKNKTDLESFMTALISRKLRGYRNIAQSVVTDCQKSSLNFNKQKCLIKNKHKRKYRVSVES